MTKETIAQYLPHHPWRDSIIVLDEVDSTNTYARAFGHGTCVLADRQHAGRGRRGRSFCSPSGGLYLSVVLQTPPSFLLTPMAAEAVRRAVAEITGLQPKIKWVNDLVVGGKKLCGILTEVFEDKLIIGIGLNCCGIPHENATSLQALGHAADRSRLAAAILEHICRLWDNDSWLCDYKANCLTIGQDVQLLQNGTVRYAHVDAMDDTGALLVTLSDGSRERIFSGENA